jgi:hypothetical protein
LLLLFVIFAFEFCDPVLHLLDSFLRGLNGRFKRVDFGGARWRRYSDPADEREANNKALSCIL